MDVDDIVKQHASLFNLDGVPKMSQTVPLALQHVVTVIVGCVTPAITIPGAVGVDTVDRVLLIQTSLAVSALITLLQLLPLGNKNDFRLDSDLPVILGVSFAYVPSMQAIAEQSGVPAILGTQIIGGICTIPVGLTIKKIQRFFPPPIAGTVVSTISLSLYSTAVNYTVGGAGQPTYGAWQNWVVTIFTLVIVAVLDHFAGGFLRLASILIDMIADYIFFMFFGMVSFDSAAELGMFQPPQVMHFGIGFEAPTCVVLGLLLVINPVQTTGGFSAATAGGLDREPTTNEPHGAIPGYDFSNIISAFLRCLPTAIYGQSVGIVAIIKVVNRVTLGLFVSVILVAGLFPKFSALLTTISYAVLGGAAISIFVSIVMAGVKLVVTEDTNYHNTSIVGLTAALGTGMSQAPASLFVLPAWVTTISGRSPAVIATLVAILLNVTLPKNAGKAKKN